MAHPKPSPCAAAPPLFPLQFVAKTVGGKRTVAGVHWDYDGYGATLKKASLSPCMLHHWNFAVATRSRACTPRPACRRAPYPRSL